MPIVNPRMSDIPQGWLPDLMLESVAREQVDGSIGIDGFYWL